MAYTPGYSSRTTNPCDLTSIIADRLGLTRQTLQLHGPRQGGHDRAPTRARRCSDSCLFLGRGVCQRSWFAVGADEGAPVPRFEQRGRDYVGRPQINDKL